MRILLFTLFFFGVLGTAFAQLITIYSEDFSSYPDGATGGNGWSGSANDCDGTGASRVGVFGGRFEWRDMEGTCGCGTGGQTDNVFEVGPIDIFGCNVTASIQISGGGAFECDSPGGPNFSCNNSHDQMIVEYSVNGGPYQLFPSGYICGAAGLGAKTITGITGNTLSIRVTGGTKASDEFYAIDNISIRGNSNSMVNITGPTNVCAGGSITLTANGTGFVDYQWNPNGETTQSIDVTAPGTYTVTATTAGGCQATAMRNVTLAPAPTLTITGTTQLCDGGNGTLTVNPTFSTYEWSTGQTTQTIPINAPGTYSVTVTNAAGCIGTRSFTVNGGSPPNVTINPAGGQTSICSGSNLNLTATGAGITSYRWSTGATTPTITINRGDTYTVTVTNALGCEREASITIDENIRPNLTNPGTQTACGVYTLPAISGTNLTGNESYFTGPNGTGQAFSEGDEITSSRQLYIFDGVTGCTNQTQFQIVVTPKPDLSDIPDQTACDAYVLPAITGTTLTNGRAYFTGPNGTGTRFNPGDTIRTTRNLFLFDGTATCNDQESFSITITPGPRVNDLRDTSLCGGLVLPPITGTNLSPGNSAYYTGPGATGTRFNPGQSITTSQTLYIYNGTAACFNEQTVAINITAGPQINNPRDTTACAAIALPPISGTGLTGNQAYFTQPNGGGTRLNPGATISTTQTLYVFDTAGACADEDTFRITIASTPVINDLADVSQCSFYVLPAITGTNLSGSEAYYTQTGGVGTLLRAGDTLRTTTELFLYDGAIGCSDEEQVRITILQPPALTPVADQIACAFWVLPAISGTGLSGNEGYFTQPNGTGTRLNVGDTLRTNGTYYLFDTNGTCPAQDTFTITIQSAPVLNPIADRSGCERLVLPALEGTNLSANAAYFTQPNGTGTRFAPGDTIRTTTVLYAFDAAGTCSTQDTFNVTINTNPNVLIRTTDVTCNGGQDGALEVVVVGTAPFRFDWNENQLDGQQNITGVGVGNYLVAVTDANNCTTTVGATITEPASLSLTCAGQQPVSTAGGSDGTALVVIGNGKAPYRLVWAGASSGSLDVANADSVTILNLVAGSYEIVLTDSAGCSTNCNFVITTAGCNIQINAVSGDATCANANDGTIDVTVTGATLPIRYDWNVDSLDGQEDPRNVAPGNYVVNAIDSNNCLVTANVQVGAQLTLPDATISYGTIICEDGCFDFDIELTGTPPFILDYQLKTNVGDIFRTITINGLRDTLQVCPASVQTDSGQIIIEFVRLRDANCENLLNRVDTLLVRPIARDSIAPTLCSTDSIIVNGTIYNQANPRGTEILFGGAANGCDSVIVVDLQFFPPATFALNDTICQTDSLVVNGTVYNQANPSGTETFAGASANGCDSIVTVNLTFFPPVIFALNDTICNTDSLVVNGTVYNQANPTGTETLAGAAANGCDSIININLAFFPPAIFILNDTICNTDSLVVNGTVYNQTNPTGTETLAGVAANGCDSIVNINLQFFPPATFSLNDTLCQNDSLVVDGTVYNQTNPSGTETLAGASANGCDSIITIALQFIPAVSFNLTDTLCPGDSLVVNGTVYNEANPNGAERLPGASVSGCDSIVNVNLSFFPPAVFNLDSTLCEGDSVVVNGIVYDQARSNGTEIIQGGSANGCDSTINVRLTFLEIARVSLDTTLCPGDSLRINGRVYNAANPTGTETLLGAAANGCDSIVTINLRFFPPATFTLQQTLCEGDSVVVNGVVYNQTRPSGTETLRGASATGCDSVVTIQLQFLPPVQVNLDSTLCEGETLTVNGTVYDQRNPRGTEIFAGASASGCDSIVNVNLTFVPPATFTLQRTICENDTIIVNGRTYNRLNPSGTETLTGASANGCDSIVTINLTFFPPAVRDLDQTLCQGDSLVINSRVYNAANPRGTEVLPGASANGCDSTININLTFLQAVTRNLDTLLCPGESIIVNGRTYNEDNPRGTEVFRGASANGCDSIVQVQVRFRPAVSGSIEGNATICAGDSATLTFRLSGAPVFDLRYSDGVNTFNLDNIADRFTVRVSPVRTTTYTITFLSVDGATCPAQLGTGATVQVSNLSATASVGANYAGFGVSCFGAQDGVVRAEGSNGVNPLTYRWNTGATTAQLQGVAAGTYTVTVTDAAGCTATDSVTVTEPQEIVVNSSTISPVCVNQRTGVIVLDSVQGGAAPFEVSLDGRSYRAVSGFPYRIANLNAGNYTVFVRDANDCEINFTTNIAAPSAPVVDLGPDVTVRLGDSVELVGLVNFDPTKIEWRPDTFLTSPNALRTFVQVLQTTTYTLTVSDTSGCSASDQITVFLDRSRGVYIPTAFTPDGDGINDFFFVNGGKDVRRIKELRIFDRWGNLMFRRGEIQPNDPQLGWDGTFNGRKVNLGVYVYYAEIEFVDGFVEVFEGDITVVR